MKANYEYISMRVSKETPRTKVYEVYTNKNHQYLGEIKWKWTWRQYCFFPENAVFSKGCLLDLADFLDRVNKEMKKCAV